MGYFNMGISGIFTVHIMQKCIFILLKPILVESIGNLVPVYDFNTLSDVLSSMTSMFQYNDQIPDFISCGYLITTYGVALILVVTYAEYLFF